MVTRMQRKQLSLNGRRIVWINILCALLLTGCCYLYWYSSIVPAATTLQQNNSPAILGMFTGKEILNEGIPGLSQGNSSVEGIGSLHGASLSGTAGDMLSFLLNIDNTDMRSLLRAELPWLSLPATAGPDSGSSKGIIYKLAPAKQLIGGKPAVGIYHTHTAESFIPTTGVTHSPGGQRGEICVVGRALADDLNSSGVPTIQDVTINDYPSFMKAYSASEVTVTHMLKDYPSLQMIFDIHRDAEKRENVITEINGESVAQIAIIVAQGQKDLPQPHWETNYALAKQIDRKLNEKYPGLSRGIRLEEWRYNQHLHPHALLLEVGSHETSTEEGVRAMQMLSQIITEILHDGIEEPS